MKTVLLSTRTEREDFEAQLDDAGVPIALQSRASFAEALGYRTNLVGVVNHAGGAVAGVGCRWSTARALPGYANVLVERFGAGLTPETARLVANELVRLARKRRVLAVQIDAIMAEKDVRAALEFVGMTETPMQRTYAWTALVDLEPDEESIFAGFHSTGRQNIRAARKKPVNVRTITESRFCPRMEDLFAQAFARTGGTMPEFNASAWIRLATQHPTLVTVMGMFLEDTDAPDGLLGYVIVARHGNVAEYCAAASTRDTTLVIPVLYAPTWEAMRWAKGAGATIWDFGGIARGSGDSRKGISNFKRYFRGKEVRVGYEFSYEPSRLRSRFAGTVRSFGGLIGLGRTRG